MGDYIRDVYPSKAQFLSKERIDIAVDMYNPADDSKSFDIEARVCYLNDIREVLEYKIILPPKEMKTLILAVSSKDVEFEGYGIDVCVYDKGELLQTFSSSFDVVSDWRKATRYGFLSDFYSGEKGDIQDVRNMCKLHLNLVQFYDWMYRHDELVPPDPEFTDLMGRKMSLDVVKEKIELCHEYGMKAIAYGAVYAASRDFYDSHRDWALYDSNGRALDFIKLFYIMNISPESPWHRHIIKQYRNAVEQVGFDGIHADAYGFPKTAVSKLNNIDKVERLQELFPVLINNTREEFEKCSKDLCIIFNNVGNWPVDSVASARQDAIYIEVWKPYERYHHIQQLILHAKRQGNGKPVILAAYLKPFMEEGPEKIRMAEISALILTSVIAANGGYHMFLGEKDGVLTQGYYVDYSRLEEGFLRVIRNYYDFIVRYSNILFNNGLTDVSMTHTDGDNTEYVFENFPYSAYGEHGKVWVVIRENPQYKSISFINLTSCTDDLWNKGKEIPSYVKEVCVRIQIEQNVKSLFLASPDCEMGRPQKLEYRIEDGKRGKNLVVNIARLYIWNLLVVEFE